MKKLLRVTIALVAVNFASPVLAAKMECTEDTMSKLNSEIASMEEGENKTKAMKEMDTAQDSMTNKNMDVCTEHMKAAQYFMAKK